MAPSAYIAFVLALSLLLLLLQVGNAARPSTTALDAQEDPLPTLVVVAAEFPYVNTSIAQLDLETGKCAYEAQSATNPIMRGWWASYAADPLNSALYSQQNEYHTLSKWDTTNGALISQVPTGSTPIDLLAYSSRDHMLYGFVQNTGTHPYTYYLVKVNPV